MVRWTRSLVFLAFCAGSSRLPAQGAAAQPSADELQRGQALFAQSDWQGTLDFYSELAQKYPTHPLSRFRVGVAQIGLGRFAESEANLREGEKLGIPAAQAGYRLAQAMAEQPAKYDAAIAELSRGIAAGLPLTPSILSADPHLSKLAKHPKWAGLLDAADAVLRPCLHNPKMREFDFWVGDWDVHPVGVTPTGPMSRNNITLEDNGCVVMEHWSAPGGSEGQSFNIFDRSVGLWRQTWVDNGGGQHDYRGSLVGGNMVLVGDTPAPNGQLGRIPTRLTLFHISKDSVRQFAETSADGGKTWTVSYNLIYVRSTRRP